MAYDIIFTCHSKNNKNVRSGELKILRKKEGELYFEFGASEMNLKKRYYDDKATLNKDFNELLKLKEQEEKEDKEAQKNKEIKMKTSEIESKF